MGDTSTIFYRYPFQDRFELPIDSSLNDMEQSSKKTDDEGIVTRQRIKYALQATDPNNAPDDSYFYKETYYGNYKPENELKKTTAPAAIYWEIQDFIRYLCRAKNQNCRAKGKALAELFFKEAASELSKKSLNNFEHDYVLTRYLNSPHIQKSLVSQHKKLIRRCMEEIEALLPSMPPHMAAHFINATIHLTDECKLASGRQGNHSSQSAVAGMKELYDSLLHARKGLRVVPANDEKAKRSSAAGERSLFFQLSHDKDQVMKKAIEKCTKDPKSDSYQELEKEYNSYISTHFPLDTAQKKEIEYFIKNYSALTQQFKELPDEAILEEKLKQEFEEYIKQLFHNLVNNPFITFQYSSFETTIFTGFLQNRIKNAHDHLIYSVHKEFTALYHPLTLIAIYNKDPSIRQSLLTSPYIQDLYKQLKSLNATIAEKLPASRKKGRSVQIEDIRDFFSCQPFDDAEITWRNTHSYNTTCISTDFDHLMEEAYWLCAHCKEYLFQQARIMIDELLALYRDIKDFHKELQEASAK